MPAASGAAGGGGGSASDVRAGGAFYEVVGKDGLTLVLDKLQSRTKAFSGFMKNIGGGAFGGGFFGAVLGGSIAGKFEDLLDEGGKAFAGLFTGANKLRAELDQITASADRTQKALNDAFSEKAAWRATFANPGEKLAALRQDFKEAEKLAQDATFKLAAAEQKVADLKTFFDLGNFGDRFRFEHADKLAIAEAELKRIEDTANGAAAEMKNLGGQIAGLGKNQGMLASLNAMIEGLEKGARTRGMSPEDAQLYEMARRGVDPGKIGKARGLLLQKEHDDLIDALSDPGKGGNREDILNRIRKLEARGWNADALRALTPTGFEQYSMIGTALSAFTGIGGAIGQVSQKLAGAVAEVQGTFSAGRAGQQFGYGSQAKDQLEVLKQIRDNMPKAIADAIAAYFSFK